MTHAWVMGAVVGDEAIGGYWVPDLDLLTLTDPVKCKDINDGLLTGQAMAVMELIGTAGVFPVVIHMMPEPNPGWLLSPNLMLRDFTIPKVLYAASMPRYLKRGDVTIDVTRKNYPEFFELYKHFKAHYSE